MERSSGGAGGGGLYVLDVVEPVLQPLRPRVPGVREVLRAHFPPGSHAYPLHTHDTWTLMVVDAGAVTYHLDRVERTAPRAAVTLLPPHVPHDGRAATVHGFRKRVVYLEADVLAGISLDAVLARPFAADPALVSDVAALHGALTAAPGDRADLGAEERLALLAEDIVARWDGPVPHAPDHAAGRVGRLRAMLDEHAVEGLSLVEAAAVLGTSAPALVRAFRTEVGITPHRYLVARRLDLARTELLAGSSVADAAAASGFFDQAHLARHFRRYLGVAPGSYARSVSAGRR
ncbi:AraC family transcriptional regulator [Alloalcanivorax gelatiniphagus]